MPKKREIGDFCQFAKFSPIEKNYNDSADRGDIQIWRKGEALLIKGAGSGGIYPRQKQRKFAKQGFTTLI